MRAAAALVAFAAAVGPFAARAQVGVRLEETGEVSLQDAARLTVELTTALRDACGVPAQMDDPVWASCAKDADCVEQIRARTRAPEVVVLRVFGSLTLVRVVADRFSPGRSEPARSEADVPRDPERWGEALGALARSVCPAKLAAPAAPIQAPVAPPPPEPSLAPWIVLGASAVALGAGVAFGASSASARDASQSPTLSDAEFDAFADRTQAHAIAADVLFITAGAGLIAGAVLLVTE